MLRIGVTSYPTVGGSGAVAGRLAAALSARGHHVVFIGRGWPASVPQPRGLPVRVVRTPGYALFGDGPYTVSLASALAEAVEVEQLDLLHCHYALPHAVSAYLARQMLGPAAPKVVLTLHGTDVTRIGSEPAFLRAQRFAILEADARTVPSRYLRGELMRRFDLPQDCSVDVIENSIDAPRLRASPSMARRVKVLALGEAGRAQPLLCHVSNFRAVKRVEDVVRVFARVLKTRPARLLMVGDGPRRPAAQALAQELGVFEHIGWLGNVPDVAPALSAASIFLQTSEEESFGLAALEAMAAGVPVVAARVGGVPEVVRDGATGLLAPCADIEALAQACLRILDDPAFAERLAAAAQADVDSRFSERDAVSRYEALYRRLLQRPAAQLVAQSR
jgi:N-acetyl-alpha-D-glucosaminyl L-malate synthase BshA